jgi:acyl-coenzyme A synthetase/AMP-(fatty) acid ligase
VLRRIFGTKRDEVTEGWKKLRNEELHNLYSSPSIIRMIKSKEDEMSKTCSTNGENIGWKARRKETTRKTKT